MPDITMCKDRDCPMRHNCYRYQSRPSPFGQSWFAQTPRTKDGLCGEFIPVNHLPNDHQGGCCG